MNVSKNAKKNASVKENVGNVSVKSGKKRGRNKNVETKKDVSVNAGIVSVGNAKDVNVNAKKSSCGVGNARLKNDGVVRLRKIQVLKKIDVEVGDVLRPQIQRTVPLNAVEV